MNVAYLKGPDFFSFWAADCGCLFTGICVQQQKMRCERGVRGRGNDASHVLFFCFLSNCDGALTGLYALTGLGSLRKQHTLQISIVNIAQTEPQRKGSLARTSKGQGLEPPPPCTPLLSVIMLMDVLD